MLNRLTDKYTTET